MPSDPIESGEARITRALHEVLVELAEPLMRAGVTPRLFGDLAARAFVKAACKASTLGNGRTNQSRVAVLTGLSRTEVRNVMRGSHVEKSRFRPRTQRVIDGWRSDSRFLNSASTPRLLPIRGATTSFAALVKKYAGDVPHHAVLEELRRLRVVKEVDKRLRLIVAPKSGALGKSLSTLLALLSDGVAVSVAQGRDGKNGVRRLTLKARDTRESIALYERALTSAASFVSGLDQSLRTSPLSNSGSRGSQITVTVLVRLKEPNAKTRRQRNVPRRD